MPIGTLFCTNKRATAMQRMARAVLGAGLALAVGCSASLEQRRAGEARGHGLHEERLQQLMLTMNALMFERYLTQPELDRQRRQIAQEVGAAAATMADTLKEIQSIRSRLPLNATENTLFVTLTERLGQQIEQLRQQAEEGRVESMAQTREDMRATCAACHMLFRDNRPLVAAPP